MVFEGDWINGARRVERVIDRDVARKIERRMRKAEAQVRAIKQACAIMDSKPGEHLSLMSVAQNIAGVLRDAGRKDRS